jgi:hypothetical protein
MLPEVVTVASGTHTQHSRLIGTEIQRLATPRKAGALGTATATKNFRFGSGPTILRTSTDVRFTVLDHKISEPWARFSCKDVGGHVISR